MTHPDLAIVHSALDGSEPAWRELVRRAEPVVDRAIRNRIPDPETRRDLRQSILVELCDGGLRSYAGRASFQTWIFVLARCRAADHLRTERGRRWKPPGFERLSAKDQWVFRLYFVDGWDLRQICDRMSADEGPSNAEEVAAALRRVENTIDRRVLRRLSYSLHANSVGCASGRLLEYLDHFRAQAKRESERLSPEFLYLEAEAHRLATRVKQQIDELHPIERDVLRLRFDRGLRGHEIAREMGLPSTRRAFTLIDRALRELRRRLSKNPLGTDETSPERVN